MNCERKKVLKKREIYNTVLKIVMQYQGGEQIISPTALGEINYKSYIQNCNPEPFDRIAVLYVYLKL